MLSVADRVESLLVWVEKINVCHVGGGAQGGQFCSGSKGEGQGLSRLQNALKKRPSGKEGFTSEGCCKLGSATTAYSKYLSNNEKDAIWSYTDTSYSRINTSLRSGSKAPGVANIVKDLDSALSKYKLASEIMVYRGLSSKSSEILSGKLKPGSVFSDKGFVSTTSSRNVARRDFGRVESLALRITVPKGAYAAPVGRLSKSSTEQEWLLPRGSKFKVRSVSSEYVDVTLMR